MRRFGDEWVVVVRRLAIVLWLGIGNEVTHDGSRAQMPTAGATPV